MTYKTAIIIPYRNREIHYSVLIPYLMYYCPLIPKLEWRIFVIEQEEGKLFNGGKLINVGFDLAKENFDSFALQGIDIMPVNMDYRMFHSPEVISGINVGSGKYNNAYEKLFSPAVIISKEHFLKVNGCSNEYYGWGREDDDLRLRCELSGLTISKQENWKYFDLLHKGRTIEQKNIEKFDKFTQDNNFLQDGLSNLEYKIIKEVENNDKLLHVIVSI